MADLLPVAHLARNVAEIHVVAVSGGDYVLLDHRELFRTFGESADQFHHGVHPFVGLVALCAEVAAQIGVIPVEGVVVEVTVSGIAQRAELPDFLEYNGIHAASEIFVEQGGRCCVF